MNCNWTVQYSPETVVIVPISEDPNRGPESGARFHVVSDWDDDFEVLAVPKNGREPMSAWVRAVDDGPVPAYFMDFLLDSVETAVNQQLSTSFNYQVDLAQRSGSQTARELWVFENP